LANSATDRPTAETTSVPLDAATLEPESQVFADRQDSECIFVIVRAFNEGQVICASLLELRSAFSNVIVVDDGSTDNTAKEALDAGAVVIRHPINLGPGAALQTGLRYCTAQGATIVATIDPDGQHKVADLIRLIEELKTRKLDFVIGSRFLGKSEGMPIHRKLVLRAAKYFTLLTTGVSLTDPHNGLRVMTGDVACRIRLRQDRFAYASELVGQLRALNIRYGELPVTITYSDYSLSKGQKTSNSIRILLDLLVGWLMR
jgi:glycosyltransferase involved in cell wall biosynthesis